MPDPRSESLKRRMDGLPRCTHWLGHKFEGRYSEKPGKHPITDELFWLGHTVGRELVAASIERTYERDICVRCGVTVERTNV